MIEETFPPYINVVGRIIGDNGSGWCDSEVIVLVVIYNYKRINLLLNSVNQWRRPKMVYTYYTEKKSIQQIEKKKWFKLN